MILISFLRFNSSLHNSYVDEDVSGDEGNDDVVQVSQASKKRRVKQGGKHETDGEADLILDLSLDDGHATQTLRKTILNHFEVFLNFLNNCNWNANSKPLHWETLEKEDITINLLGCFGGYILKRIESITKPASALSYMSALTTQIEQRFGNNILVNMNISSLRRKLSNRLAETLRAQGKRISDKAEIVEDDALNFILEILFDLYNITELEKNAMIRFANRLFLIFDKVLVGRIMEIRPLKYEQIFYNTKRECMTVRNTKIIFNEIVFSLSFLFFHAGLRFFKSEKRSHIRSWNSSP